MKKYLLIFFFLNTVPVTGQEISFPIQGTSGTRYMFKTWRTEQGLPQNSVNTIVQSSDGFLWFGTQEGLVRFDGNTFTVFDNSNSAITDNVILSLYAGKGNVLWIGTNSGLMQYEAGTFSSPKTTMNLANFTIASMYEDHNGSMWMGTRNGLLRLTHDTLTRYTTDDGLLDNVVTSLNEDYRGNLLIGTSRGVQTYNGSSFSRSPKEIPAVLISSLLQDKRGTLWIGTLDAGLYIVNHDGVCSHMTSDEFPSHHIRSMSEGTDGAIFIGTDGSGIYRIANGNTTGYSNDVFRKQSVPSLYVDHEGSVWIGTNSNGIMQMKPTIFASFRLNDQLSNKNTTSLCEAHNGDLWIGTDGGGVNRIVNESVTRYWGPMGNFIRAIYEDHLGNIWIGTTDAGISKFHNNTFSWYTTREGLPSNWITSIAEDSDGHILVGTRQGLCMLDNGMFVPLNAGMTSFNQGVLGMHRSSDGTLWVAVKNDTLYCLTGKNWTSYGINGKTWKNSAVSLYQHRDGSLWMGTAGNGLYRLKNGHCVSITKQDGLFDNVIHQILEDDDGRFWMSSNKGIFFVSKQELDSLADGTCTSIGSTWFNAGDGMITKECNGGHQPSGIRMKDGRLLLPTIQGLIIVDPTAVVINRVQPPVVLEQAFINNANVNYALPQHIAPGRGEIEFHIAGLCFLQPEKVRYKYRLEGFDNEWVDGENRQWIHYTNIPPGEYTFHAIASNNDGLWNNQGITYSFILEPHYYQTAWFIGLCILGAGGTIAGTHTFYRRYRDRGRVASELKSQLVETQLAILKSQLKPHFLFNTLNSILVYINDEPDVASRMVSQLSILLRMSLDYLEMREISLKKELEFLEAYLDIQRIRFEDRLSLTVTIDPSTLDASVPTFILQPLVENAITHGFTQSDGSLVITIETKRHDDNIDIRIMDNGSGFSGKILSDHSSSAGIGLSNTRERLQYLYGHNYQFVLKNKSERGATVFVSIPYKHFHSEYYS